MHTTYQERMALRQNPADRIIAEVAAQVAGIHDPRERLARQVGLLQAEIRKMQPSPDPKLLPRGSFCCSAEIDDLGDCVVFYDYSPGRPGRNYMPNGDPGYPDDPAELYVTAVQVGNCEFDYEVFSSDVQASLDAAAEADVEKRDEAAWADFEESNAEQRELSLWSEDMGATQ